MNVELPNHDFRALKLIPRVTHLFLEGLIKFVVISSHMFIENLLIP